MVLNKKERNKLKVFIKSLTPFFKIHEAKDGSEYFLTTTKNVNLKMPRLNFNHHELLTNDLTMVINGKRNAGKTTLLFNLLTTPGILDFNNLMIFSKTIDQYL